MFTLVVPLCSECRFKLHVGLEVAMRGATRLNTKLCSTLLCPSVRNAASNSMSVVKSQGGARHNRVKHFRGMQSRSTGEDKGGVRNTGFGS